MVYNNSPNQIQTGSNLLNRCEAYCINLETRPDRWEKVQQQFALLSLQNVQRYAAKTDVSIRNTAPTNGEHSVIETNLELLCVCHRSKPILIFQDDVYFLMECHPLETMDKITAQLPDDFGILYLGAHLFDPKIKHPLVTPNLVKMQPEPNPTPQKDHVYIGGAHAIVFSQRSIKFILSQVEDVMFEAQWDVFLSKHVVPAFPCFMAYPTFAFQVEDFSDLEGKQTKRDWIIKHNKKKIKKGQFSEHWIQRLFAKVL